MRQLFRVTCGLDAVVAATSAADAHAYAADGTHEVSIEPIAGPEILLPLGRDEATVALASLEKVLPEAVSGANTELLHTLHHRLAQALDLLDEQEQLLTR